MNKDLEKLTQLQTIDIRIVEIRRSSEEFPRMVADLESAIGRANANVDAAAKKIVDQETDKKNLLSKLTDAQEGLKKSEERLNSIKTNREYDAVHAEIEGHKHTLETTESKAGGLDAGITAARAGHEEAVKALETVRAENEPKIAELKAKIATIDSQIAEVVKERDALVPQIAKPALRMYEHILKKRKTGQVIATIGQGSRNCSVCHKVLESQLVNEIRKGDRIQTCQSCGSILLWVADAPAAEIPAA